jgi:hypothetical protein
MTTSTNNKLILCLFVFTLQIYYMDRTLMITYLF